MIKLGMVSVTVLEPVGGARRSCRARCVGQAWRNRGVKVFANAVVLSSQL